MAACPKLGTTFFFSSTLQRGQGPEEGADCRPEPWRTCQFSLADLKLSCHRQLQSGLFGSLHIPSAYPCHLWPGPQPDDADRGRQPREWRAEYGGRPREAKGGRVSGVYREQDRAQRLGVPHNEMGYSNGTLSCGTQVWSECFSVSDYPNLSNRSRACRWESKLPCRMSYASPEVNRMRMRLGSLRVGMEPHGAIHDGREAWRSLPIRCPLQAYKPRLPSSSSRTFLLSIFSSGIRQLLGSSLDHLPHI